MLGHRRRHVGLHAEVHVGVDLVIHAKVLCSAHQQVSVHLATSPNSAVRESRGSLRDRIRAGSAKLGLSVSSGMGTPCAGLPRHCEPGGRYSPFISSDSESSEAPAPTTAS